MEDSEIIELYWNRSEQAIKETTRKYGGYCRSIAEHILKNQEDSEECVNDTYLRAWNSIPPERPMYLRAWLGRITRNLSFDRYKMGKTQKRGGKETVLLLSELEDCIPSALDVEQTWENEQIAKLISSFLREQPMEKRVIFVRRYYYGDSILEISGRFSMGESKIKSILFRLRKSLKAYLEKEGVVL